MRCKTFKKLLDLCTVGAVIADGNHIADTDKQRGNVCLLAVDAEVIVQDELACFCAALSHAHSVNNVVKAALEDGEQVCTGHAFLCVCHVKVVSELLLLDAVVSSDLLLLTEMHAVFTDLLACVAMLTGNLCSAVQRALAGCAAFALQIQLYAFSAAHSANRTCISCHCVIPPSIITRVCA